MHALPAFRRVREILPHAHISWLVEDRFAEILKDIDGLDEKIIVPRRTAKNTETWEGKRNSYLRTLNHVRDREFDLVFDFQGLLKSAIWTRLSGARHRIGYGGKAAREGSWLFYTQRVDPPASIVHIIERHLFLVGSFFEHPTLPAPNAALPVYTELSERVGDWLAPYRQNGPLVLLNPGAGWITKQWPSALYARLACALVESGCQVLALWGPGEKDLAREIEVGAASPNVNLLPPTSIHEMIEVIRQCDLLVAGDTGPLHIAAAVGTRTVGIFGPSEVERNGPYGEGQLAVRNEIECLECWKHTCGPPHDRRCMTELSVEHVHKACVIQLERQSHKLQS